MTAQPLLSIDSLRTFFYSRSKHAFVRAVDGVSLQIGKGETVGLVGESGSGKSITAMTIMGLINSGPGVVGGRILFTSSAGTVNLLDGIEQHVAIEEINGRIMSISKDEAGWEKLNERNMAGFRGKEISMIFQNPRSSLNPFVSVGSQIAESVQLNTGYKNKNEARERALYWLEQVKIDSPNLRYNGYPAILSGGMCQRAMIAMALSAEPSLLIADEPTTGLDATIQAKIVELLEELKEETGVSTLLISHDISVVARLSDRIAVMYGGTVVEFGPVSILQGGDDDCIHPYTAALLASIPSEQKIRERGKLSTVAGDVLDTINVPAGCRFYERCNRVTPEIAEKCATMHPPLQEVAQNHQVRCWLRIS